MYFFLLIQEFKKIYAFCKKKLAKKTNTYAVLKIKDKKKKPGA
jgi:hypothetical protein